MFQAKCLFSTCLLLCLCSTTAKSFSTETNEHNYPTGVINDRVIAMITELPALTLRDLDRVHEHLLRASDDGIDYEIHHTNITGFKDCYPDNIVIKNRKDTELETEFNVICPHILVRYKSADCKYDVNSEGVGKCQFCYNDYVFRFKTEVALASKSKSNQHLKLKKTSDDVDKRNKATATASYACVNEIEDGLTQERRLLLSDVFEDTIFDASSKSILKLLAKHLQEITL